MADYSEAAKSLVDLIASRFGVTPPAYDRDLMAIEIDHALRARFTAGEAKARSEDGTSYYGYLMQRSARSGVR